ncbi:DUF3732 domain-containing protein [Paenibacillus polymyxa]|uniref:DUF3732 domain-containing protein n=1 Tax=Paenibacillus polymyxa TaxID=1406 RepID=UPI0004DF5071|nr:DUF3732 domain-containing protein [Paenibacillus polymyxa]MEE4577551.1 DUF3732 domain-containing protein [Paenibacillus polymyxa]
MQILEIVLYSYKGQKRIVSLNPGKANIITGSSGTGKSALIEIVEYCLGRSKCLVPEGIIRDTVSWFGVRLKFNSDEVFIGRANPSKKALSTNAAYLEVGTVVPSPEQAPSANTTNDAISDFLTQKIGISPNIHTPPIGHTRDSLEANIKHALFYCFQQQDEIASKRNLFHRQSEEFMKQTIKDTLPYFLGAIQEDRLALEQELARSKRELKKAEQLLKEAELIKGEGVSKAISLFAEAQEVGLSYAAVHSERLELFELANLLKPIAEWKPGESVFPGTERLTELQSELYTVRSEHNEKAEAIRAAKTFVNEAEGYSSEVKQQEFRLESIALFNTEDHDASTCPLCSGQMINPVPHVTEVKKSLERVKENLETTMKERPRLREYIETLEKEKEVIYKKIQEINQEIDGIFREQSAAKQLRDLNVRRGRVAGRISLWLESIELDSDISKYKEAAYRAKQRVISLKNQLDEESKQERLQSIFNRLGIQMTEWSNMLKLEHSGDPVRFDLTNVTVVIDREERPITLERMGSGQNWVAYHLIVHLALHKYFAQHGRPIPRFLFLDQPTQVYYPRDQDAHLLGSISHLVDDDKLAVKRMFDLVFDVVEILAPDFQVIITDHADLADERFQSSIVERWRGEALIPNDWH